MPTHLPAELTDAIVDFLHSDRRSLSSCSLVCRDWLPTARYHLFHRMEITARNVESLIRILNTPACAIPNHVIHVHLHIYKNHTPILIVPYLERFMAITSLTLTITRKDLTICKEIEEMLPRGSARFMKMDLTGITSCLNPVDNPKVTFTLGCFGDTNSSHTFLSRLRSLHSLIDNEFSWLLSVTQFPAVTDICLHRIRRRHLAEIHAILRTRGPSIRAIDLCFSPDIGVCLGNNCMLPTHLRLQLRSAIVWTCRQAPTFALLPSGSNFKTFPEVGPEFLPSRRSSRKYPPGPSRISGLICGL
jgi:hypothetical protein